MYKKTFSMNSWKSFCTGFFNGYVKAFIFRRQKLNPCFKKKFCFGFLFLFLLQRHICRKNRKQRSFFLWFIPQTVLTAGLGRASREPLPLSFMGAGAHTLRPSYTVIGTRVARTWNIARVECQCYQWQRYLLTPCSLHV